MLVRAGLVDNPSYLDSVVEIRSAGGLVLPKAGNVMAVAVTAAELAAAIRLGDSDGRNPPKQRGSWPTLRQRL